MFDFASLQTFTGFYKQNDIMVTKLVDNSYVIKFAKKSWNICACLLKVLVKVLYAIINSASSLKKNLEKMAKSFFIIHLCRITRPQKPFRSQIIYLGLLFPFRFLDVNAFY